MAFHPCMKACWQRWKHHGNILSLISSSQCTHWCIDCSDDQRHSFCCCLVELRDNEQKFIRLSHQVKGHIHFHFSATLPPFLSFLQEKKNLLWLFLSVKCCWSPFRKGALTYFSSYDDSQCDYAEGCLSTNSEACSSLLHLLVVSCSCLKWL